MRVVLSLFVLTLLAKAPYSAVVPIAYEPILAAFGRLHPPVQVAAVATLGTLLMEWLNYRVFGAALAWRRLTGLRSSAVVHWIVQRFWGQPFVVVALCALLPFPFGITRACAVLARYPLGRHLGATALGRLPRYWLCAAAGAVLPLGTGQLLAAAVVATAVPLFLAGGRRRDAQVA